MENNIGEKELYISRSEAIRTVLNESLLSISENFDNPRRIVEAVEKLPYVDSLGIRWYKYPEVKPEDVKDGKVKYYMVSFKDGSTEMMWWVQKKEDEPRCRWMYGDNMVCYWAECPVGPVASK